MRRPPRRRATSPSEPTTWGLGHLKERPVRLERGPHGGRQLAILSIRFKSPLYDATSVAVGPPVRSGGAGVVPFGEQFRSPQPSSRRHAGAGGPVPVRRRLKPVGVVTADVRPARVLPRRGGAQYRADDGAQTPAGPRPDRRHVGAGPGGRSTVLLPAPDHR